MMTVQTMFKQNQEDQNALKEVTVFRQARVLSPILFIVMMDELVTSIKGEKRRLDMKTLILADEVLIWEKDKQKTEEKLNQWNLIIKEYRLRISMDKTVNMSISRNLDTNKSKS